MPDVYPFERLEIELLKGNRSMKVQEFLEPSEKKAQETKSLEVTFSPTDEDIGKALFVKLNYTFMMMILHPKKGKL